MREFRGFPWERACNTKRWYFLCYCRNNRLNRLSSCHCQRPWRSCKVTVMIYIIMNVAVTIFKFDINAAFIMQTVSSGQCQMTITIMSHLWQQVQCDKRWQIIINYDKTILCELWCVHWCWINHWQWCRKKQPICNDQTLPHYPNINVWYLPHACWLS